MALNQTNRLQCLDSPIEEFIDGQENENTKKKTKHDVALFHEFLVFKGETRRMNNSCTSFSAPGVSYYGSQKRKLRGIRGVSNGLRAFASMRAVRLFLRAIFIFAINFLMRAASTLEITNSEH